MPGFFCTNRSFNETGKFIFILTGENDQSMNPENTIKRNISFLYYWQFL